MLEISRTEQHQTGSGNNQSTTTRSYNNHETYMNFSIIFISKPLDNDLYLECGEYTYPFQIVLPQNLPPSFQHHIGKIRYYAKGTVDIPW
jgi:hypothetical protein